jgi:ubiquinone/menaquinone biosynthesis C-methylase UbiE
MNDEQTAYWNGPAGERWTEHQVALDRALAAFGHAAVELAAAAPGEHVLDIGCGCGDTSLLLADRVGASGSVLGIDLSQRMLARARQRAAGRSNLTFMEGDATSVRFVRNASGEGTSAAFDILFSRFGVMFFEDPIRAFNHLHSAAKSGSRLVFVCWRAFEENPWAAIPLNAVRQLVPETQSVPDDRPGPYAFADPAKFKSILESTRFHEITVERFDADVVLAGGDLEEAVEFAVSSGPAARLLANAAPAVKEQAQGAVRRVLEPLRTATGFALPGSAWLVSARA